MDRIKIGKRLRDLRGVKYTQEQLAKEVGTSVSAVGMYERGERMPSDDIKVKYSQLFGVSVQALFFD